MVALGARTAGVMANDDALRGRVVDAASRAGEAMWPMPLPEELRKGLDSTVADIANMPATAAAACWSPGMFLREFVPDGRRWAHIDIAGPAFNDGRAVRLHAQGRHRGVAAARRSLADVWHGASPSSRLTGSAERALTRE